MQAGKWAVAATEGGGRGSDIGTCWREEGGIAEALLHQCQGGKPIIHFTELRAIKTNQIHLHTHPLTLKFSTATFCVQHLSHGNKTVLYANVSLA